MSFTIFKNEITPSLLKQENKCVLRYSRTKKTPFYAIKTRISKSPKIEIFPKGLTHCFGSKRDILKTLLSTQYRQVKCALKYSRTKKRLSTPQKKDVKKVKKFRFFPKGLTQGFGPKWPFFQIFVFRKYRPGKCVLRYSRTI